MLKDYAQKIVKASGVVAGELVLIHFWGEDAEKWIANEFVVAVAALGATPVLLQEARSVNRDIFLNASDSCFDEKYFSMFTKFDAVLDIFAYQPVVLGYEIGEEKLERYRRFMARLFSSLMQAKRFSQIRIPTKENAVESGLEPDEYVNRMERAYNTDYDELLDACIKAKDKLEGKSLITLCSGENCKLSFDLTGRTWNIDAGDGDWPCGEIYIAPNESATNGTVFFHRLFIEDVGCFDDVTLHVENGRLTQSDNDEVTCYIQSLPAENAVVCELGLGMNPNVDSLCGYTVLDEKMANSFHIAIGANNMFGGTNVATMHTDFVGAKDFELHMTD